MRRLGQFLKTALVDQSGATAIEYAMIASLISIIIVGALLSINGSMTATYDEIKAAIVPALQGTNH